MNTHEEQRSHLENLLTQVLAELESIAIQNPETGDWEATVDPTEQVETDENTEADASEELTIRVATVTQLEGNYRNITLALEKIARGTYGFCEICSEPISTDRLLILPSARTCTLHMDEERTLSL